jgi:predicted phage tail component-like protein
MYGFVDTIPGSGTGSTSLSIQTVFNGINLDEELTDENGSFITLTVSGRSNLTQKINTIEVPGMDGLIEQDGAKLEPREITVKYKISDRTNEGFRKRLDKLNSLLEGSKRELTFTDENSLFYATLLTNDIPEEESNNLVGTITFLCSDPFKYGPEKTYEFQDSGIVENNGTAEADPIFELTATAKSTFAMVSLGDEEYNLIGRPTDVDEEVVDTRTLLFSEDGSTLNTWTSAGTSVDGGAVTGAFGTDGAGITIPDYGTGSAWHGPALIKEVQPVQDFEVVAHLQMRTTEPNQTSRIEVYLFDENMNVLGKMAVVDNARNKYVKKGEARIGPYVGRDVNYLISSQNYQYNWDYFFGMLRIRRVGKEFEFYITRIHTNTQHVFSLKETYIDNSNHYAGKLKYIQIHAATYGDTPKSYSTKFFTVSAYELAQTLVDETPYILYPGDVVTFDHSTDDILINGEPRMDLKNFGGSFFKLKKGENVITVTPENSFETKVRFRERYR